MVLGFAALETIELRIALQWLGYTVGEVIAEAVILSMGAKCFTDGCPGVFSLVLSLCR